MSEGDDNKQAPASNPGSNDPSAGIATGNGGDETTKTDTANEVREAKDESKSADTAPTDRANEENTAKTDTEGAQPGEGGGGSEETGGGSELKKTPTGKENREAIPTAGGERLGDKHWGESKVVPDVPKKQEETPQVASEEGQPDKATQDNTAQNTGGAPPPASSTSSPANNGKEGKISIKDKLKAKLNIGSKKE